MNNEQLTPRITPTLITSYPDQLAHILNRFIEDFYDGNGGGCECKGNLDSIEQTTTSYDDGGVNIVTAYLSDGTTSEFQIRNGKKGSQGNPGTPGADGHDGADGQSATVSVGTTTTLPAGSSATVSNVGTSLDAVFDFGIPRGADGQNGQDGQDGQDGFSPIATVSKVGDTATITITDENGTTTASVTDGADGFSPIATVSKVGDTATITITDENGTTTASVTDGSDGAPGAAATISAGTTTTLSPGSSATVTNSGTSSAAVFDFGIPKGDTGAAGADGADGADGFSPIATVTKSGDTATISITDANGTTTATVTDGTDGAAGPANTLSIGTVVSGATADATITGAAPNQTLNLVLPKGDPGTPANVVNNYSTSTTDAYSASYVNGVIPTVNDATLTIQKNGTSVGTFTANASSSVTANITVPTAVSELSNDSGYITSIPIASANDLGGIKVGANLSIDANGVLSATGGGGTLPSNLAYIGSEVAGGGALIESSDIDWSTIDYATSRVVGSLGAKTVYEITVPFTLSTTADTWQVITSDATIPAMGYILSLTGSAYHHNSLSILPTSSASEIVFYYDSSNDKLMVKHGSYYNSATGYLTITYTDTR